MNITTMTANLAAVSALEAVVRDVLPDHEVTPSASVSNTFTVTARRGERRLTVVFYPAETPTRPDAFYAVEGGMTFPLVARVREYDQVPSLYLSVPSDATRTRFGFPRTHDDVRADLVKLASILDAVSAPVVSAAAAAASELSSLSVPA